MTLGGGTETDEQKAFEQLRGLPEHLRKKPSGEIVANIVELLIQLVDTANRERDEARDRARALEAAGRGMIDRIHAMDMIMNADGHTNNKETRAAYDALRHALAYGAPLPGGDQ